MISRWKWRKKLIFSEDCVLTRFKWGWERSVGFWKSIFSFPYEKSSEEGYNPRQAISGVSLKFITTASPAKSISLRCFLSAWAIPPTLGPQYLEVRIWSLTEIMSKASYGHQPHKFQAGALGIYMFHHGYCLWRQKAMFTFTKRDRRHLYQTVWPGQRKASLSSHPDNKEGDFRARDTFLEKNISSPTE